MFQPVDTYVFLLLEFSSKLLHEMFSIDLHLLELVLRVMMLLSGDGQVGLQQRILGRDGVECEFTIVDGGLQFLRLLRQRSNKREINTRDVTVDMPTDSL